MGGAIKRESQPTKQVAGALREPPPSQEPKAAPTRIEVTIPIPLDMYQDSRPPEDDEVWDHRGREGIGVGAAPGAELGADVCAAGLAGAGGTADPRSKDGTSPLYTRAPLKEDASGQERDEDRDVDETSEQDLPSLVGQRVSPGPEVGFCVAATKEEALEEFAFEEKKSHDVLGDAPREALLGETEARKAEEDQEERRQPERGEEYTDIAPPEPSATTSQAEAEPREGEDAGPLLETASLPARSEDDTKDKDAALQEAVPEAGGRRTPKKKPSAPAADKAGSRVPLLKGVCAPPACSPQGCPSLLQLAATSRIPLLGKWPGPVLPTDLQSTAASPSPSSPRYLILDVLASLPDPHALVLRPLAWCWRVPIVLGSPGFVSVSSDLGGGLLNSPPALSQRRNTGWCCSGMVCGANPAHAVACS